MPEVKRIGTVAAMRVLVVDDEVDLAEAIARGLRREGYAVDLAHDGEDALEKARLTPYDLICLDITMPKMDGRAVCRAIRADPVHAEPPRILMLTARDEIQDMSVASTTVPTTISSNRLPFPNSPLGSAPSCAATQRRAVRC